MSGRQTSKRINKKITVVVANPLTSLQQKIKEERIEKLLENRRVLMGE